MAKFSRSRWTLLSAYLCAAVLVTLAALRAEDAPHAATPAPQSPAAGSATVAADPHLARAIADMTAAAQAWWTSLTPEQQALAHFDFDNENRTDWHFIPRTRKGLPFKDMEPAQKALAVAFLASGLSPRAFIQAEQIMSLDAILKQLEPGPPKTPYRDPENYSYTIFGAPAAGQTWGWRVEGHHLSVNITVVDGKYVAGGPVFLGTNPAEVRTGPRKGLRVLSVEEDDGFKLVQSLDDAQKNKAIIEAKAPKEIVTGNTRKANPGPPVGIPLAELKPEQKAAAIELVKYYAHRLRGELSHDDVAKIEQAGWDKVYFAWAGATAPGDAHYYRLHGPTFLVEFDNTQNNANHIHTVWRDAANDFGEDLLKEHYAAQPHEAGK